MKKSAILFLMILFFLGKWSTAQTPSCSAQFSITNLSGNSVQFNPAQPGDSLNTFHSWNFGDFTGNNSGVSPAHTYQASGTYTVLHYIQVRQNGIILCMDSFALTIQVQSQATCNVVANFITSPLGINALHFANITTPLLPTDSIRWTFGDGTSSNQVNPDHTYLQPGNYIACLRVQERDSIGALTNCISEKCDSVFVAGAPVCNLTAGFYSYNDTTLTGTISNVYQFVNTSLPFNQSDSVRWTFGDGSSSGQINPIHTYAQPGTYNVCLRVQQRHNDGSLSNCISEICHLVIFQGTPVCNLIAGFTATSVTQNVFNFQNTTIALHAGDSIRWSFGDGTASSQVNPTHTYAQPGNYIVCLRVQQKDSLGNLTGCVSERCDSITIQNTTCILHANFYSYSDSIPGSTIPVIHFVNTSTPFNQADSVRWTFGDGTSSIQISPTHTYAQPGMYLVCLRVQQLNNNGTLSNCISEVCDSVSVLNASPACTLQANFYSYTDSLPNTTTLAIHFVNTTTPFNQADSVRWTFGDGTSSNQNSPVHQYAHAGTYTVCIRVQQRDNNGQLTNCISETCQAIVVSVPPPACNLAVSFIASSTTQNVFHFENISMPLQISDSIRWTFGDGTSSGEVSPTHTYTQAGVYTVCLTVQQNDSTGMPSNCAGSICHTVTAATTCNLQAYFTWAIDSLNNETVIFSNNSVSAPANSMALWSFGDGTSDSSWNTTHVYAQPGTYYVCLHIESGPNCTGNYCDTIIIQAPATNCTHQSGYTFTGTAVNSQLFYFTPEHINTNWQYTWTFGDGTGSHDITTSHLYTQPGNYMVCLTVYQSAGCASTTCHAVNATGQQNCDSAYVSYSYQSPASFPNKLYFQAVSNYMIVSQTWSITRIQVSASSQPVTIHQNNPYYIFNDTGYYRICLHAVTANGCIKEYCQVIHISQVINNHDCSLQLYPNPAHSFIVANVHLDQPQMINIFIYNVVNVLVKEIHRPGFAGNNSITVPIVNLIPGLYRMKVTHGNDVCHATFLKL